MPRLTALFALILIAACTKVDTDVKRAKMSADFKDIFVGRDRGYFGYREMIEQATVRSPRASRYQYNEPAWVSNYIVTRAVRGLGGTVWPNADYLAGSVDRLMYVMHYDPTPIVRATACSQLGRIAQRIGVPVADPYLFVELADEKIQQVSQDLFKIQQRVDKGERIKESLVIERLDTFETLYPTRMLLAIQMMRALSSSPVVQAAPGPLRDTTERVIPAIARRTISIALAQLACGNVYRPRVSADESAEVRGRAVEVLNALNDPVARDFAVARLWDQDYPAERDEMVRMRLLEYLGNVGGPGAFEAALRQLDSDFPSIRFHAQAALLHMTGAKVEPSIAGWRGWRAKHPEWRLTTTKPPTLLPPPTTPPAPEAQKPPEKSDK